MKTFALAIALLSALAVIIAEMLQTSSADGFSAAMGGSDRSRFKEGSREAWLDSIVKYGAIVWVLACLAVAILWYKY